MIVADGWEINHSELQVTVVIPDVSTAPAWPHVHMILNHVPTVGFVFAIAFFVVALLTDNDLMKRASLVLFVICSVVGVPTYVSGTASMWALTQPVIPEISKAVINAHRDMALLTLFGLAFTGAAAWIELWRYRYLGRFSRSSLALVMLFAVVTLAIMAETGHRGGQINHPEIRVATEILPTDPEGTSTAIEALMKDDGLVPALADRALLRILLDIRRGVCGRAAGAGLLEIGVVCRCAPAALAGISGSAGERLQRDADDARQFLPLRGE